MATALSLSQMSCAPTEIYANIMEAVVVSAGWSIQSLCSYIAIEKLCCGVNTFVLYSQER